MSEDIMAPRQAPGKYRTLYDVIDEGFCIVEVLYDEGGQAISCRYLDGNPAFEKQAGVKIQVGSSLRDEVPSFGLELIHKYAEVIRTGEPARLIFQLPSTGKWYDLYAARSGLPDEHQVTVLFNDITEAKHAEDALRRAAALDAFRVKLADTLRPLSDPFTIQAEATQVLGEYLGVSRVMYGEVADNDRDLLVEQSYVAGDLPTLTGEYRMSDFGAGLVEALRAGRTITLPNIALAAELTPAERESYAALGIAALVGVPLLKGGRFVANLNVHHSAPRAWTPEEIALIQETAERTWDAVQRARAEAALHQSEAQIQKALSMKTVGVLFFRLDGHITDANDAFLQMSGYTREELLQWEDWATLTSPEFMQSTSKAAQEIAETGETEPYEKQMVRKDGTRWWGLFAPTRLSGNGFESECVEFIIDITERKRTEQALQEQRATLQSFYDSAPFLMGIAELDGDQILAVSGNRAVAEFFNTDPLALPGKTGIALGSSEDFERLWVEKYRRSQSEGIPVQFDYEHLRIGGSQWLRATVAFLGEGPSGNPRFSFVVEDITKRKRVEEELRENQTQLQILNETLEQQVQEKTAEVRHLASDLVKAIQRERRRISHVLHDDLQQRIYAIQMQLSFLRDGLHGEHESLQKEVSDIDKELADILKITRHLSIDLSPPILRGEGLLDAINWLAGRMRKQYNLLIDIQAEESFILSNEDLHVFLFNCIRELLFNIVKHAEARQAVVALQRLDHQLRIEVRDDGKGFSVESLDEQAGEESSSLSLGLPTIRHQLSLFGGSMEIHSEPGKGAQVILLVPISETQQGSE